MLHSYQDGDIGRMKEIQESRLIKLEKEKFSLRERLVYFQKTTKPEIEKQEEEVHIGNDFRKLGSRRCFSCRVRSENLDWGSMKSNR